MRRTVLLVVFAFMMSDLAGFAYLPGLARAHAQTGGGPTATLGTGYDLTWWTMDNGGDMFSAGGGYSLGGTIGQPDTGAWSASGYTLAGGFWLGHGSAPTPARYRIYLPVVLRRA